MIVDVITLRQMKRSLTQIGLAALALLLFVSVCVYHVMTNSGIRPETYADSLLTKEETYANLERVERDCFLDRLYYYQDSECVPAMPSQKLMPNTANDENLVPAFRYDGDIYIITYKWVGFSRGLAISDSDDFIVRLQSVDRGLTAWHIRDNVYGWDLETDSTKFDP